MKFLEKYPLKAFNTFGIEVDARAFTRVASTGELIEAMAFARQRKLPVFILGGGSNVLFTSDYEGLIVQVMIKGIEKVDESKEHVVIKVGAGEVWDDWVTWAVGHAYGGLENLSLIPGSVGAGPIQNIGAYGVEISDCFHSLEFLHFDSGKIEVYHHDPCRFGYRNSIFKQELKGKGAVVSVSFRLNKIPKINMGYGSIHNELEKMGVAYPGIKHIRQAVIRIRQSKLPDPAEIGNAGSFFKNPILKKQQFDELQQRFPGIISFAQSDGNVKLAAGWLIDQCGWKGVRKGDAGVHEKQALVLVNHGSATGKDILQLSAEIQQSVLEKFGMLLEREVNVPD